ncbi:unnamed protein product [Caenorhabditis nigoni]
MDHPQQLSEPSVFRILLVTTSDLLRIVQSLLILIVVMFWSVGSTQFRIQPPHGLQGLPGSQGPQATVIYHHKLQEPRDIE